MKKIFKFWWIIPLLLIFVCYYSTFWVFNTYDNPSFEQILFHLSEPIFDVEAGLIFNYIYSCIFPSIVSTIFFFILLFIFLKKFYSPKREKVMKISVFLIFFIVFLACLYKLGIFEYLIIENQNSTFIGDNYVNPTAVDIDFPSKKRNLIYIFAESIESSYTSLELGGLYNKNLIPELTALARDNLSFSDTEKIGGAYQLNGTSWTTASLVAHTAGIPLKLGKTSSNNLALSSFLPDVYSIGDILSSEGYNQTIMFGSDGNFGNRKLYFETHGNYIVSDYYDAIEKGRISENYSVWWGYEDKKLFEYAKEEAINLSNDDKPFNLTLLTVDTHSPNGYLDESCKKRYSNKYENVIACSSYQIYEFIEWCKLQDFYENTTIIISGDHLTMNNSFFKRSDKINRRIFNVFINSPIEAVNTTNRKFSALDMFPTTLAALGVKIGGNRLGLGTNLFSGEKTIIEKYGIDAVNKVISYKSDFYNEVLLKIDK